MTLDELVMSLGLEVNDSEWNLGQAVIEAMKVKLRALAVAAATAVPDLGKAMHVIGLQAPKAVSSLDRLHGAGDKVTSAFKRMAVAAAGYFAISRIESIASGVIDLGGKLNDMAQKTGISAEALQEWGYAASQNSSSLDEMSMGMTKLSRGLYAMKGGAGPLADAFKMLGISLNDPAVKSKDLDKILMTIASRFAEMPDGPKKTAAAMGIFGKSGASLIPTLNQGAAGLNALKKRVRDLGGVIDGKAVGALDNLGDSLDDTKVAIQGLKNRAIIALVPMLQKTVNGFLAWVQANKDLIATKMTDVIGTLVAVVQTMASVVAFAVEHWKALAVVLGAGAIVSGILSIIKMVAWFQLAQTQAALQAVINWAMILGPILLIAAAVLGLGYLIYKFRDKIKAAFTAAGRWIKREVLGAIEKVRSTVGAIGDKFWEVGAMIKNAIKDAFDYIVDEAAKLPGKIPIFGWLGRKLGEGAGWVAKQSGVADHLGIQSDEEKASARGLARMNPTGAPSRTRDVPGATGASSATVVNNTTVTVDASSADAKQVGATIDQKLRENDERNRRQTAASLGLK